MINIQEVLQEQMVNIKEALQEQERKDREDLYRFRQQNKKEIDRRVRLLAGDRLPIVVCNDDSIWRTYLDSNDVIYWERLPSIPLE